MALIFKFDESYDNGKTVMLVGGWLMEESQWKRLENAWDTCIKATNQAHRPDQQIARFHATNLNGFKEEFNNWDKPMSEALTSKLVAILKERPSMFVAAAVNMQDMVQIFPLTAGTMLESALGLCVKQVMISLGHVVRKNFARDKLAMVLESGSMDDYANTAFKQMIADKKFKDKNLFSSLSFMPSKVAGLQAADLIAYESMKRILSLNVKTDAKLRWALRQLLGNKHLGESAYIARKALLALRGSA
ncbi:MAG: hypothetical protein ACLQLH_12800 [Terracidiphilus sp.]